jgi:hypothetical protein
MEAFSTQQEDSMKNAGITLLAAVLILLFSGISMADRGGRGPGDGPSGNPHHAYDERGYRGGDHRGGHDYDGYRGYREGPYDRGRHYGYYKHDGHRYEYRGHWRSWDEWDRYARRHPEFYRYGHYYRDDVHLMFRFCDPGNGACFFFSIGS